MEPSSTRWWTPRAISARCTPAIWPGRPPAIRKSGWMPSAPSSSGTSTRIRWTLSPTTTAPSRSPPFCPPPFQTCWYPPTRASPWAWPPTCAASIWARCATPPWPISKIPTATSPPPSRPPTSPPAGSCSTTRKSSPPSTGPGGAPSRSRQSGGMSKRKI